MLYKGYREELSPKVQTFSTNVKYSIKQYFADIVKGYWNIARNIKGYINSLIVQFDIY